MEEFVAFQAMQQQQPQFHQGEEEKLKCPRCDSFNTKFCYYNNYNLAQPRHYCKNCKRYWTKGGSLRNIPVGGSSQKKNKSNKRSASPTTSSAAAASSSKKVASSSPPASSSSNSNSAHRSEAGPEPELRVAELNVFSEHESLVLNMGDIEGGQGGGTGGFGFSFSSLLASDGQIQIGGGSLEAGGINESSFQMGRTGMGQELDPGMVVNGGIGSGYLGVENGSEQWSGGGGGNMWPDLTIYTPPNPTFE